jgi:hypothetical protein
MKTWRVLRTDAATWQGNPERGNNMTLQRFLEANKTRQLIVNFDPVLGYSAVVTQEIDGKATILAGGLGGDLLSALQDAEQDIIRKFSLK